MRTNRAVTPSFGTVNDRIPGVNDAVLYSNALPFCSSLSRKVCWPMPQWMEIVTKMAKR